MKPRQVHAKVYALNSHRTFVHRDDDAPHQAGDVFDEPQGQGPGGGGQEGAAIVEHGAVPDGANQLADLTEP